MRISLPSGAWIEAKDNTAPGDRFAVQDAVAVTIEDGTTTIRGAQSAQWRTFLARVVTAWSYDAPLPCNDISVLDSVPSEDDDIDALEDALLARFERITRRRSPNQNRPPAKTNATSSG